MKSAHPDDRGRPERQVESETTPTLSSVTGIFDVAISFSSREPEAAALAEELSQRLRRRGLEVFYFRNLDEAANVLGERLGQILPAVFRDRARLVVLVASRSFGETPWTRVELAAVLERPRDDDGRPRVVPISADGSRVPGLPKDLVHLGENVDTPFELGAAVDLIARRCGRRGESVQRLWPYSALLLGAMLAVAQFYWTAAPRYLVPWTLGVCGAGTAWTLLSKLVPWLSLRKKILTARTSLRVVIDGPRLRRFRRKSQWAGLVWTVAWIALVVVLLLAFVDARLAARDIGVLIEERSLVPAMNRMEVNRDKLSNVWEDLRLSVGTALEDRLASGDWRTFPQIYPRYARLLDREPRLESAYLEASGIASLQPGESFEDHLAAAERLVAVAPDLARKLFEISLARELEHRMDGNDFYYGSDGTRAWSIYREFSGAPGWEGWVEQNSRPALGDLAAMGQEIGGRNLGLAARLVVHRMLTGDEAARASVLSLISMQFFEEGTVEELAEVEPLPEPYRGDVERALVDSWNRLHATSGPTPEGFSLARTLAGLRSGRSDDLLLESSRSEDGQERAHAVHGLSWVVNRATGDLLAACRERLLAAARDPDRLVRYALARSFETRRRANDGMQALLESELESFLSTTPDPSKKANVEELVDLYRTLVGMHPDPELIAAVAHKWNLQFDPPESLPTEFKALVAHYENLGAAPGAAPDARRHADALGQFGSVGDPQGILWLTERFDSLAHGNMRISAVESLWLLQGRLGKMALDELKKLTNLKSSIYRIEVVQMLARREEQIVSGPADERTAVQRILTQTVNTGESAERGLALDLLGRIEPNHAWRLARGLAVSSSTSDRLEGVERLAALWPILMEQGQAADPPG